MTNQNNGERYHQPMRTRSESKQIGQARENADDQAPIIFSLAFDWLKGWREFSGPIARQS